MDTTSRIHFTRKALAALLVAGIALALFAVFIGAGLPALIMGIAATIALLACLVGLIVLLLQKSRAESRNTRWRPTNGEH
ncbi:hypothetical protein [Glutamicibacter sp.]|uniref:hypothetical protein n=1 Tax=Glutamicibacter sp. TaxID=1931995 RepID=UPI003D6A1093